VGGYNPVHWVWYFGQGSQNVPALNIAELVQAILRSLRIVGTVCTPGAGLDPVRSLNLPFVGRRTDGLEPGLFAPSRSAERARRERGRSARLRGACVAGALQQIHWMQP
jgi:hypothetical protein